MNIFNSIYACLSITGFLIGELATIELYFIRNIQDNYKLYWIQKGEWKIL